MSVSPVRRYFGLGSLLLLTACSGNSLGGIGDIIGAATGGGSAAATPQRVSAEIRSVNTQQQTIEVRTENGQTGTVRYDQNTVVVYQNQQYQVNALERGDVATLTVQEVQGGTYVSRVDVQQSVQERTGSGSTGEVVRVSGRVAQISQTNGTFVLQSQQGNITVSLPANPPQATLNYFRSLRNGSNVTVEVVPIATGRGEIHRFL